MTAKIKTWIVQQSTFVSELESMPLASGYLKAYADADPKIHARFDIRVFSFDMNHTVLDMASKLLYEEMPDVLCFSVLGWNYNSIRKVVEIFKQERPEGVVIYGGNHVSDQAKRVFREIPGVDLIVNGEGELTFREVLGAIERGESLRALHAISGISFRDPSGETITTAPRERIRDLDIIPSPVLTGALPMVNERGEFRYDVALMETNRGCPYKCSYCYWGGAIGQKIRSFSRERLRAELEVYAKLKVHNVILCDANFGMLPQDLEFVEDFIEIKAKYGYPRNLDTCWAKNKSKIFYEIVAKMKEAGLASNFTLALQTLSPAALANMNRSNMRVNEWEDLVKRLDEMGLECYAELIWSCPGETYDSFIEGYDKLTEYVSRIAVYPHLLIPNTHYYEKRADFGLKAIRGEKDDYEYVLSHSSVSIEDNRRMHRFLFWARLMGEYMIFRHLWYPLRRLGGVRQSELLLSLDAFVEGRTDEVSVNLRKVRDKIVKNLDLHQVIAAVRFVGTNPGVDDFLRTWWREDLSRRVNPGARDFVEEAFNYDLATRPVVRVEGRREAHGGDTYFVIEDQTFAYDVPEALKKLKNEGVLPAREMFATDFYFLEGFERFVENHEFYPRFAGKASREIFSDDRVRRIVSKIEGSVESMATTM